MKILHTSDWHLGRMLYGKKRYPEFKAFLNWLIETIKLQEIDILLIAGDVFDTTTPSNYAQELYFQFLSDVAKNTDCQHVVVIGGNHDSPSLLEASKSVLKALNIYVVGAACDNLQDEVIVLKNDSHIPQAIICAVPYLRDRDIRKVEASETLDDKNKKLISGIKQHYHEVCKYAKEKQIKLCKTHKLEHLPMIGMGHLFAAGGKTEVDDGVRELYVGSLAHVDASVFPDYLDYVALGHLHVPQMVAKKDHIRYSGSPIAMGFGEAKQQKQVLMIDFEDGNSVITPIAVPCFQPLVSIKGNLEGILAPLSQLITDKSNSWLEIEYIGKEIISDLTEQINAHIQGSELEIRRIKNKRIIDKAISQSQSSETLEDLDEIEVFERCLAAHDIPKDQQAVLMGCYQEIMMQLVEEDVQAQ
ncbi:MULTISPECIES: exonuclease SbcCD subunit D C-terminal domain-containing protein [Cysteiniphilum]|uniref:Nuclease SbcCD subunit D n=1 Tax=Cysteiniphilum litorale TaxID=2056700 RepID=A0A8J2Z4P4_9GAMM|nr:MULTISPECIES: exonuclease SbcCD subunit D C-terminal domain-containing protein [Cysteiniphilum]GGF97629.1 nuclease SbcCD subunit D [Cysteiniphilum litorale]